MKEVIDFFRRLHDDNTREWFDAHRAEWTRVKGRFADFTGQLIGGIASFDPEVRGLRPQDCTYRIARDTRFSPDKSPYKTYIGAYIAPKGKEIGFRGILFPHRTLLRLAGVLQPAFGGRRVHRADGAAVDPRGGARQRRADRGGDPEGQRVPAVQRQQAQAGPDGIPGSTAPMPRC